MWLGYAANLSQKTNRGKQKVPKNIRLMSTVIMCVYKKDVAGGGVSL